MKNRILFLFFWLLTLPCLSWADNFVNLTPTPRIMEVHPGELVLPQQFVIGTAGLSAEMNAETEKFAEAFNFATDYQAKVNPEAATGLIMVKNGNSSLKADGYKINVTNDQVTIEANTTTGLYYAFQSIKKVLPANVMAGVKDTKVTHYSLPLCQIEDYPNYGYRGFMLDTSRHFFSVKELKRVLEVMSYYKMNRFHWHLTDDQGWRIEIKKYPKLTSVGSISDNSYMVDMKNGDFWLNKPYGPHFYTQKEVKEVVEYAKERHIEIIPEIDMPGHFSAAMASYPEFSCDPEGAHNVVSNIGGVYSDVLNVANPKAVQFAKNILTEIMEMFPGEYIHIGGDECPTTAWEKNAECIKKKNDLHLHSFRELQSHFIKDMTEHLLAHGRKVSVWNEAITANGADTKTIKSTDATVYCWVNADAAVAKAANLGLNHIYTPQVPWYINRKQSTAPGEPIGAGKGTDNLEVVYKQNIPANSAQYFRGVQATFWSEYVAFDEYLEYLMLPRLVAIAEAGWTPKSQMDFKSFQRRITADSTLFNYNNYTYGKHYMTADAGAQNKVMPNVSNETKQYWYRLVTQATDERANKCMELLSETSPLNETYKGKGAKKGVLWTNTQVEEGNAAYDYQLWALEEDANHPGHYALVCKGQPKGSLNPNPTAQGLNGRWQYDNQKKHYNFILADNGYGKDGDHYFYSIRCDKVNGLWLNFSKGGQGFAVNLYDKPSDGNGGLWSFIPNFSSDETNEAVALLNEAKTYLNNVRTYSTPAERQPGYFEQTATTTLQQLVKGAAEDNLTEEYVAKLKTALQNFKASFVYLEKNQIYTLTNAIEGFEGISVFDNNKGNALQHTTEMWTDNAWVVTESKQEENCSQIVKLKNVQTQRFISGLNNKVSDRIGHAVYMGNNGTEIHCVFQPETQDFLISINNKNLYPVSSSSTIAPGTVYAGSNTQSGNAIRPQGAAWNCTASRVVTFVCQDLEGQSLGTFRRSVAINDKEVNATPEIKNYEFVEMKEGKAIYKRTAYTVRTICRDKVGALLSYEEKTSPLNETYQVALPELPFYTLSKTNYQDGETIALKNDVTIEATYATEALNGVKILGNAVTSLEDGHSYVIYDCSPSDAARKGFRNANTSLQVKRNYHIDDTEPNHTWILEKAGDKFKVKNTRYNLYVPLLSNSTPVKLAANGGVFTFTLNADGETWKIKGSNGVCWDGLGNGALVGWNDPGHPYKIYEYYAQPYFKVKVVCEDTEGKSLGHQQELLVKAGEAVTLVTENLEGYTLKTVEGSDALQSVSSHLTIKVIYENDELSGIEEVTTKKNTEGIFDLSGRQLQRISHKGIYIINGQKVLVK